MFPIANTWDTIVALATPPGVSGLAVIRVSGHDAFNVCDQFFRGRTSCASAVSHTIHHGWWEVHEQKFDEVTVSIYRSPRSYTGEDVVEIGCHGGTIVVDQILASLRSHVRLAEPGEFTRRAFLNGKMDLTQVEAVADLILAQSTAGAQTAARQLAGGFTNRLSALRERLLTSAGLLEVELDFSEEGYEFVSRNAFLQALEEGMEMASALQNSAQAAQILRSGFYCAIVGYPNAGKSSLFNALLLRDRAIVSDIPGTTRDYLQEAILLDGCAVHLVDTAGLRDTSDTVELQGILLTTSVIEQSHLILVVNDASIGLDHSNALVEELQRSYRNHEVVVVQNKMDLIQDYSVGEFPGRLHLTGQWKDTWIPTSCTMLGGIEKLRAEIRQRVASTSVGINDVLVNARQAALLRTLHDNLESAASAIRSNSPADLVAVDVRAAIQILGEITGETWNPDILDAVFSRFCIGK